MDEWLGRPKKEMKEGRKEGRKKTQKSSKKIARKKRRKKTTRAKDIKRKRKKILSFNNVGFCVCCVVLCNKPTICDNSHLCRISECVNNSVKIVARKEELNDKNQKKTKKTKTRVKKHIVFKIEIKITHIQIERENERGKEKLNQ